MAAAQPLFFDLMPLTLEEVFVYELEGEDYAVKDIIL
jgi:ABC-2 type transport system ATP-binding protein